MVKDFLAKYPISTCGALNEHRIIIEIKEHDGDSWCKVIIPYWSENECVTRTVLNLAYHASLLDNVHVYLEPTNIIITFYKGLIEFS